MIARVSVPLLVLSCLAAPAAAQASGPYLRLSLGVARVEAPGERFRTPAVAQPSAALGMGVVGGSVELRAAYLRTETTERATWRGDAPHTIGVRAVQLGAGYQARLPFPGERIHPVVGVGASWTSVTDTWASDTPAESRRASLYGVDASAGLVARLAGAASLVVRGGYRFTEDGADRYARAIGLSGAFADVGLQLALRKRGE
jgi:hypothetical protein